MVDLETARTTGAQMPNSRFVELPGDEAAIFLGDTDTALSAIESFLRQADIVADGERPLATVLFTDIVESTRCPHW